MSKIEWTGTGAWEGWKLTTEHAASSHGQPVLVSPTGIAYGPGDIESEKVYSQELMSLIGCSSKQALTDRISRGTVPPPDGRDGRNRWWLRKNIAHLIK